jgi:hypothetical protein
MPSRTLWQLGALAFLILALFTLWWMIQGAWIASFPGRDGEMNPPMLLRVLIFIGSFLGSVWMTYIAKRR